MRWARRLAPASAVLGVVLFLSTLGFVLAEGGLSQRTALLLFVGVALLAVYPVVEPAVLTAVVRGRRPSPGSLGVVAGAAMVGILVAVNVVASRTIQAADLTRSSLYTLSPHSAQVVRQLDADLQVTGFFRPDQLQARRDVQTLLDLYRRQSPHVKVRFVDPGQEGLLTQRLGVQGPGSVVLQYKSKPPVVLELAQQSEADVTAAMQRLESTRTPTVCWGAGDGERDLKDTNEVSGYSAVAELLRTTNYRSQDVLPAQQGVPGTCDVLVVLQLGRPLGDAGVRAIQDYLAGGGNLLLAIDPWLDSRIVASANAVLLPYGAAFGGGLVVEPETAHAATDDPTVPVVYSYGSSPITRNLERRYVFLPQSTPITGSPAGDVTSVDLASTTDRAYAIPQQRTDLERRSTDRPGPFVLVRTIERKRSGSPTRIVLSGTSALAENRTMPPAASGSNPELLLASLDWLTEQDSLISIAPKPSDAQPLALTERDLRWNEVLTVGLLPLPVVAAGILVLARRRRS
jgi:ABC-type uncharacterized transport system involved in gliding motility auxiliary subunit